MLCGGFRQEHTRQVVMIGVLSSKEAGEDRAESHPSTATSASHHPAERQPSHHPNQLWDPRLHTHLKAQLGQQHLDYAYVHPDKPSTNFDLKPNLNPHPERYFHPKQQQTYQYPNSQQNHINPHKSHLNPYFNPITNLPNPQSHLQRSDCQYKMPTSCMFLQNTGQILEQNLAEKQCAIQNPQKRDTGVYVSQSPITNHRSLQKDNGCQGVSLQPQPDTNWPVCTNYTLKRNPNDRQCSTGGRQLQNTLETFGLSTRALIPLLPVEHQPSHQTFEGYWRKQTAGEHLLSSENGYTTTTCTVNGFTKNMYRAPVAPTAECIWKRSRSDSHIHEHNPRQNLRQHQGQMGGLTRGTSPRREGMMSACDSSPTCEVLLSQCQYQQNDTHIFPHSAPPRHEDKPQDKPQQKMDRQGVEDSALYIPPDQPSDQPSDQAEGVSDEYLAAGSKTSVWTTCYARRAPRAARTQLFSRLGRTIFCRSG